MTSSIMWQPSRAQLNNARMTDFMQQINQKFSTQLSNYKELHNWSIAESEHFWKAIWDYFEIIGEAGEQIVKDVDKLPGAQWFPHAKLNFAENLLRYNDDKVALI